MESLDKFCIALVTTQQMRESAYAAGLAERIDGDHQLKELLQLPRWHTLEVMQRIHRRVRRLYLRQHWWNVSLLVTGIDWPTVLDWLYANWDKILSIILLFIL